MLEVRYTSAYAERAQPQLLKCCVGNGKMVERREGARKARRAYLLARKAKGRNECEDNRHASGSMQSSG